MTHTESNANTLLFIELIFFLFFVLICFKLTYSIYINKDNSTLTSKTPLVNIRDLLVKI